MLTLQDFGRAISTGALRAPFFLGSLTHPQNGALRVPPPRPSRYKSRRMAEGQIESIGLLLCFIYRRPTLYPVEIAVDFLKSL